MTRNVNRDLLYVGPGTTPHDRRILDALRAHGWSVTCAAVDRLERAPRCSVTLAGPIPSHTWAAAEAGLRPLIALSWGSDLLLEARRDDAVADRCRIALAGSTALWGDCATVLASATAYRRFAPECVLNMPWGVDRERFMPGVDATRLREKLGWTEAFVVFTNRTMADLYRVDVVIDAFAAASRRCRRLRLLLLGDGPLAPAIRSRVEAARLGALVHAPGRVNEDSLPDLLRASDLYVSASSSDGSSISLLQAMAAGVPVVATDLPSNAEWIDAGRTGALVPVGDADALAAALLDAVAMPTQVREARIAANLAVVAGRADWRHNAARLSDFCAAVAEGAR